MQIQKIANFFDHQCFTFRILKCNMYLQNMKKVTKFAIMYCPNYLPEMNFFCPQIGFNYQELKLCKIKSLKTTYKPLSA